MKSTKGFKRRTNEIYPNENRGGGIKDMKLEVEKIYLERLRKLKGEERVKIASDLFETVKEIAKAGILSQYPGIGKEELKRELKRRLYK